MLYFNIYAHGLPSTFHVDNSSVCIVMVVVFMIPPRVSSNIWRALSPSVQPSLACSRAYVWAREVMLDLVWLLECPNVGVSSYVGLGELLKFFSIPTKSGRRHGTEEVITTRPASIYAQCNNCACTMVKSPGRVIERISMVLTIQAIPALLGKQRRPR